LFNLFYLFFFFSYATNDIFLFLFFFHLIILVFFLYLCVECTYVYIWLISSLLFKQLPVANAALTCLALIRPTLKTVLDAFDVEAATQKKLVAVSSSTGAAAAATDGAGAASGEVSPLPLDLSRIHLLWKLCLSLTDATTSVGVSLYPPLDKSQVMVREIE
jgi:hypothetical protein